MDSKLPEILAALEMPPEGLERWFEHLAKFCNGHGGERRYGELLKLISECEQTLKKGDAWTSPSRKSS